jgi:HopJ type III effector protein
MNKLELLLKQIHEKPETVEFNEVIDVINNSYQYTPVRFSNGPVDEQLTECVINVEGENIVSCKIFSFALIHHLDESETLHCFGEYYRNDVLKHPENIDHANIRTFIKYGWQYIRFEKPALN